MRVAGSTKAADAPLAALGGHPTCTVAWPSWPRVSEEGERLVAEALGRRRWAVSGPWRGERTFDAQLAEQFAAFVGVRHAVPMDHGSSALLAALVALGVQRGDEVIVPGLTWVACASAVLRAGAVPVLADIDPATLCVSPAAVEAAVTPRTAAILAVHLYSAMADMDELRRIARAAGLALVEDAAQAHGARWRDARAGSLGDVGVFSMQEGKVMTAGEGGAAVTDDSAIAGTLERLRGDGRAYRRGDEPARVGRPDLDDGAGVQGWNMHMTELQAALLLDALARLPVENARRARAARMLDAELERMPGVHPVRAYPANVERTYYHYAFAIDRDEFADLTVEAVCDAVGDELGAWVHPTYPPLDAHPLYRPLAHPPANGPARSRLDPARFDLPEAHRQSRRVVLLHHPMLLADPAQLAAIPEAVDKVRRFAPLLAEAA